MLVKLQALTLPEWARLAAPSGTGLHAMNRLVCGVFLIQMRIWTVIAAIKGNQMTRAIILIVAMMIGFQAKAVELKAKTMKIHVQNTYTCTNYHFLKDAVLDLNPSSFIVKSTVVDGSVG